MKGTAHTCYFRLELGCFNKSYLRHLCLPVPSSGFVIHYLIYNCVDIWTTCQILVIRKLYELNYVRDKTVLSCVSYTNYILHFDSNTDYHSLPNLGVESMRLITFILTEHNAFKCSTLTVLFDAFYPYI